MAEMRYIFAYYNHLNPEQLTQDHIASYINYIKKEHGVGRDKCRIACPAYCGNCPELQFLFQAHFALTLRCPTRTLSQKGIQASGYSYAGTDCPCPCLNRQLQAQSHHCLVLWHRPETERAPFPGDEEHQQNRNAG